MPNFKLMLGVMLGFAGMALGVPDYFVSSSDRANAWTSYDPNNQAIGDDSQITGPLDVHSSDTGALQQFSTSTSDNGGSTLSRGDVINSPIGDGTSLPVTWQALATSTANGAAGMGSLHAYASASQQLVPFSVSYVETDTSGDTQSQSATNPLVTSAFAQANVSSRDMIMVESATLPYPSVVQIRLTMNVDGMTNASGGGIAQIGAEAYCDIHYQFSDYSTGVLNYDSQTIGGGGMSEVFSVNVGSTVYLNQSLGASAGATSYVGPGYPLSAKPAESSATADAADTANFYLDILTPGAELVSISGHDYSSVVPEPGVVLIGGLVMLGMRRSRV